MRPLIRVPLTYGAISAVLATTLSVILYYMDIHPFLIPVHLDSRIILFIIFIFFSLKELRDNYRGGMLSFSEGLICCFLFVTFFSVISSLLIGVFAWAESDFVSSFIGLFRKQVEGLSEADIKQIGKENINRNLESLSSTNAFWMAWNYFKQSYWIGTPIGIIFSVIIRRQPKT
jgi:hypothetical protein